MPGAVPFSWAVPALYRAAHRPPIQAQPPNIFPFPLRSFPGSIRNLPPPQKKKTRGQAAAADVTHRRALKAALNSCVRLCVVAPTVNINLDDRSRSFCSGLPEEKIRAFVEGSVLPRFTRVLLQPGSDGEDPAEGRGRPRRQPRRQASSNNDGGGGGGGGGGGRVAVPAAVESGASAASSSRRSFVSASPLSSSSSSSGTPGGSKKELVAATWGPTAVAAVDDPALHQRLCLAESDEDDDPVGRGGGGGGDGHGQGDFDKWLRDLLVDMQTSIERHVASVFQTQTAAAVSA